MISGIVRGRHEWSTGWAHEGRGHRGRTRNRPAETISLADYAMQHTAGFWTNKRMPDAANRQAILHRKGRTDIRTAVCPRWGAVSIDDACSGPASNTRYVTFHVLRVGDPAWGLCGGCLPAWPCNGFGAFVAFRADAARSAHVRGSVPS